MSKLAIDVVLLPSDGLSNYAIELNKGLLESNAPKVKLDSLTCVPHISLCMGVIEVSAVSTVNMILQQVVKNYMPLSLIAENIEASVISTGETVSGIRVTKSQSLVQLQQQIMTALWPHLSYDVDKSMLFNPVEIEDVTFSWIRGYARVKDNPAAFKPHITIGLGSVSETKLPMEFIGSRIALFQLGNYCTCRKLISVFELGN